MEHFISHHTNGPNIVFEGIDVPFQSLRGHVKRTSYIVLFLLASEFILFGKPKISDFGCAVTNEDVGQFQVSMQEAFLTDLNESGNNVLQEFDGFFLSESSLFLDESAEIALIAKLGNNVAM